MRLKRVFRERTRSRKSLSFLTAFVTVSLILGYSLVSLLLFKTPWTHIKWKDTDFHISGVTSQPRNQIIVLHWTSLWGRYFNARVLTKRDCPFLNQTSGISSPTAFDIPCRITYDRRYLKASNALLFHSFDLARQEEPKKRDLRQLWVYLQQESPMYTGQLLQDYPNVFNWTMTYRPDSDVYFPYGHVVPRVKSDTEEISKIKSQLKNRTRKVAWIVSSCNVPSKRMYFVKQLQQYINVDIYGKCSQEDCPEDECYNYISLQHKFYLSFENALCTNYITEKFFTALKFNVVPVVYGGTSSKDYSTIAPKGSYIDTKDFKSPKELSEYLLYLDKNDDEYMKFFEWKNTFKVIPSQGWCNICQRIYDHLMINESGFKGEVKTSHVKWYRDLWKWWNYKGYDDTRVESNKLSSLNLTGYSYYEKGLETQTACINPLPNFTTNKFENGSKITPEFGRILNGQIFAEVFKWVKYS